MVLETTGVLMCFDKRRGEGSIYFPEAAPAAVFGRNVII